MSYKIRCEKCNKTAEFNPPHAEALKKAQDDGWKVDLDSKLCKECQEQPAASSDCKCGTYGGDEADNAFRLLTTHHPKCSWTEFLDKDYFLQALEKMADEITDKKIQQHVERYMDLYEIQDYELRAKDARILRQWSRACANGGNISSGAAQYLMALMASGIDNAIRRIEELSKFEPAPADRAANEIKDQIVQIVMRLAKKYPADSPLNDLVNALLACQLKVHDLAGSDQPGFIDNCSVCGEPIFHGQARISQEVPDGSGNWQQTHPECKKQIKLDGVDEWQQFAQEFVDANGGSITAEQIREINEPFKEQILKNFRSEQQPIDLIIFCPRCGNQHIDQEQPEKGWNNPPHKSHQCHFCHFIWRVADVPTNGVAYLETAGKSDSVFYTEDPEQ